MLRKIFTSPKTSWAAIGTMMAIVGQAITTQFDADPTNDPNWLALIGTMLSALGLLAARDNSTTSEAAGAKTTTIEVAIPPAPPTPDPAPPKA